MVATERLFIIFIPDPWGNDPIDYIIFFKWVETTNQICVCVYIYTWIVWDMFLALLMNFGHFGCHDQFNFGFFLTFRTPIIPGVIFVREADGLVFLFLNQDR